MSRQHPRAEFTDVDRAGDPQWYVRCLDFQHTTPFNRRYKERAFALLDLAPGQRVLDIGCGLGADVLALADAVAPGGEVVGLDASRTMIDEARARARARASGPPVSFVQGDAHRLDLPDGSFDRCRADKTFQHLPDPRRALAEMIRVTQPGGRILIVEPDHESRIFDSPYPAVSRRFFDWRNATLRQPGIAHRLYAMFKEFGLGDIAVEPLTQVTTDYEEIRPVAQLEGGIRLAQQYGAVTEQEADGWIAALDEAVRAGRFFHAMTYFVTTGRKPA